MVKVSKIKGLCSRTLQERVLAATEAERPALMELVEGEKAWMINKMRTKGFELEATVAGIYGVFTRGPARGTVKLTDTVGTAP